MRRPFPVFLLALLAWCIGFQSVALGARCADGSRTGQLGAAPDGAHAAHAALQAQDMSDHDGCVQHLASDMDPSGSAADETHGCECGSYCAMPGCMGSASASGPVNPGALVCASTAIDAASESPARLHAAHGLDLIRPPSKS